MPFFSPNFHHELYFKMFNYTNEEIKSIRKGLDNLIIIKPSENAHVDIKNGTISHVTDYQGYVLDALMLQVKAAVNLIERKAEKTGVNISNVIIEREDYDDLVLQLFNATFAGYSGQVDFNSQCNRITNTFVILNYFSEYINGSYCNETLIKGFIITTQYSVKIRFYTQNGSMTMESSIMFKDKTYNIPLDHIERLYIREPKIVNSLIAGSAIIYIIMTVSYVTCIYYQDKHAKIYNESWLYQNNDITYNFGITSNMIYRCKTKNDKIGRM
jgi:atrial natriuretic peptide receptor A